ncbi:hypothetical protein F4808DRAFT_289591 [Astrocystis sublimbata]|nr:hypothetical protein F4808DRAFT_289591 [Astrocystis sublimbata]
MPSVQSTVILTTAVLGSLFQHAAAAPDTSIRRAGTQFPDCISTCMRNSGCFDTKCICKKADDGILSDIVICMNQWCPSEVTAMDLIKPLEGECDLSKSAVQDAEKKGGVADNIEDDDEDEKTTSSAPAATATATPSPKNKDGKDSKDDDDEEEIIMTMDLGSPQTAGAATSSADVKTAAATTVTPAISGTLTVPTDAATTGLLTDGDDKPTGVDGTLGAATSTYASVTPTASGSASGSDDKEDSTDKEDGDDSAAMSSKASIFGVIAAVGVALALGF